ncbi:Na+/H+ antiporter subunit C [Methylonatrum kenyense]|uniref:Na+/H+ antiporter subunit C n=1 Tax=Methylonatrum kenyense TaxID=455253 RepID=UPI0020BF4989|nr:Na+/H+ antiporter subunit C [Methylonatrum kenyense]MCK8517101.1 Na+/H+ antiporter subunit C [Methylonatrum kenyense]
MGSVMAVVVGALFAASVYMMLRRSIVKLVIGLILLSNAANLLIFTVSGLTRGAPPLIPEGMTVPPGGAWADPLPQALILTAIVIGFGVLAFAVVLIHRAYEVVGEDDMDQMRSTDS